MECWIFTYDCVLCRFFIFSSLLTILFRMKIPPIKLRKANRDNLLVWADQEMLDAAYTFVFEGNLDHALNEVRPSSDWGLVVSNKDKNVCSKYDTCIILIHKCIFSLTSFCLPFNNFKIIILNHLLVSPSQLRLVNCVYVYFKVFNIGTNIKRVCQPLRSSSIFSKLSVAQLLLQRSRLNISLAVHQNVWCLFG